jgi:hypothetical protein
MSNALNRFREYIQRKNAGRANILNFGLIPLTYILRSSRNFEKGPDCYMGGFFELFENYMRFFPDARY